MIRYLFVALMAFTASTASAGVIGQVSRNTVFTAPDSALSSAVPGHTGYALSVVTDDGSLITAVDVSIIGKLHQRWVLDADGEFVVPTPASSNISNGDSHLLPVTGALVGAAYDEDNNLLGSPLFSTATRHYGYGTFLRGAWGVPGATQTTGLNLGYIVVPNESYEDVAIVAAVATTNGTFYLGRTSFGWTTPSPRILASTPIPDDDRSTIEIDFGNPRLGDGLILLRDAIQLWNAGEGVINILSRSIAGPQAGSFATGGNGVQALVGRGAGGASVDVYFFPNQGYGRAVLQFKTDVGDLNFDIAAVPEPSTLILATFALLPIARRIRLFTPCRKA